jgi:hypothetical protein
MTPPRGNIPRDALRWTVESAAREFDISKETVRKRLTAVEEYPDAQDKCYSTGQIVHAIFSSIQAERLREMKGRADNWELRNGALRGELLNRESLSKALGAIFSALTQIILSAPVPRSVKDDLLTNISSWPVAIRSVSARQSRQIHLEEKEEDDVPAAAS